MKRTLTGIVAATMCLGAAIPEAFAATTETGQHGYRERAYDQRPVQRNRQTSFGSVPRHRRQKGNRGR